MFVDSVPVAAFCLLQKDNPQWLMPSDCFDTVLSEQGIAEADVDSNMCSKFSSASNMQSCRRITATQPLYTCSYKSLSSFYQIQQHIRRYGAVISR
jgi:hypothetical protein